MSDKYYIWEHSKHVTDVRRRDGAKYINVATFYGQDASANAENFKRLLENRRTVERLLYNDISEEEEVPLTQAEVAWMSLCDADREIDLRKWCFEAIAQHRPNVLNSVRLSEARLLYDFIKSNDKQEGKHAAG